MSLKNATRNKNVLYTDVLSLTVPSGKSYLVKSVYAAGSSNFSATIKNGNTSVGFFMVNDEITQHLFPISQDLYYGNILEVAKKMGLFKGYPVMEGDVFTVECSETADIIGIVFEEYEAEDLKPDDQDGKHAKERFQVIYGTNKDELTEPGEAVIDKCMLPSEFKNYPFESDIPPGTTVEVHGILAPVVEENSYTGSTDTKTRTKRLHLYKNREELFHPDGEGFYMIGSGAADGSKNIKYKSGSLEISYAVETHKDIFPKMREPIILKPGDELLAKFDMESDTSATLDAETLRLAYLCKVIKE